MEFHCKGKNKTASHKWLGGTDEYNVFETIQWTGDESTLIIKLVHYIGKIAMTWHYNNFNVNLVLREVELG